MKTSDFDYHLPEELIAQTPIKQRDSSRLLKIDRSSGEYTDLHFSDILSFFNEGDCLVLNETRVIPARLYGNSMNHSGQVEVVLLSREEGDVWKCMTRPGKKTKVGESVDFGEMKGHVEKVLDDGLRLIRFDYEGVFNEVLDRIGIMPLPPYIKRDKPLPGLWNRYNDKEDYQTVYAKHVGAVAAPTAGLHFTDRLLKEIDALGVKRVFLTLHVGAGTFLPVKTDDTENHKMHAEYGIISPEVCDIINNAKREQRRIIAVGTTSVRLLESAADDNGVLQPFAGETNIFITPGYKFKIIDNIITNFHLPKSTLFMLICAIGGTERMKKAYEHAIAEKYRFYSYGDSCFIKRV